MADKKVFPLERILTVSLGDFLEHIDANENGYYYAVGVHAETPRLGGIHEAFALEVPIDAEFVVDYRVSEGNRYCSASGTALVPKKTSGTALIPKKR